MKTPSLSEELGTENARGQDRSVRWFTRVTLAAGILLVFLPVNGAGLAEGVDFCRLTSQHAAASCRAGVRSDYLLALGKCDNLRDPAERRACRQQAWADQKDGMETCEDQYDARQAACKRLGGAPYDPVIDPENFVGTINNPYLPLKPGTTFIYEGPTPTGPEHRELIVTRNTRDILGVRCVEVHDIVMINDELEEDTLDWFAQDMDGNVWYFGENSKQVADGLIVGLEGTWTAGVDGAKPGIIMEAHNAVGDFYRQEFSLDTAEDLAEVQSLTESVKVRYGSFDNCLKTLETTPLNLSDVSNKFYCPGIGEVLTRDLPERLELVQITTE